MWSQELGHDDPCWVPSNLRYSVILWSLSCKSLYKSVFVCSRSELMFTNLLTGSEFSKFLVVFIVFIGALLLEVGILLLK